MKEEYYIFSTSFYEHPKELQDELDRLGELGWRFVSQIQVNKITCLVLIREKE